VTCRGIDIMQQTKNMPPREKTYPEELKEVFEKAQQGDRSVLPQLKQAFDDHPELVDRFGDLVLHAQDSLLASASASLLLHEAVSRKVSQLRARLMAAAASELEKLLVDRICVSWIEVYASNAEVADRLQTCPGDSAAVKAAERRYHQAHVRYLASVKALATVQKLARPAPSPIDLLRRPVSETRTAPTATSEPRSRFPQTLMAVGVDG
jgi:hypothetical protein